VRFRRFAAGCREEQAASLCSPEIDAECGARFNPLGGRRRAATGAGARPRTPRGTKHFTTAHILMTDIIGTLIIGLVVGAIAKLLMPGRDPGGCIITILLGIAGSFVGTFIGRLFFGPQYIAHWIASIIGAMLLLLIYRLIVGRRSP
jgi:uncharacterized membrane protein YeaQ/YmgE (transglycosylase-associated protein family)